MNVKLLTEHHFEFLSLTGGCKGSPESTLVKIPHCWKSRVAADLLFVLKHAINLPAGSFGEQSSETRKRHFITCIVDRSGA